MVEQETAVRNGGFNQCVHNKTLKISKTQSIELVDQGSSGYQGQHSLWFQTTGCAFTVAVPRNKLTERGRAGLFETGRPVRQSTVSREAHETNRMNGPFEQHSNSGDCYESPRCCSCRRSPMFS